LKLEYLSTLRAVIQCGSFAAAAAQSHLTPSGVSQRMQQLESYFGRPLFSRSGRNAKPTALALEVAGLVGGVLDGLEALRERRQTAVMGRVRIGAVISAQLSMMPACLKRLRMRHPTLEVDLQTGSSQALLAALADATL
jgi:DNA-binding transcriptional LysR family regulator